MRTAAFATLLVIALAVFLFWSRMVITRVPGYTTPPGQTPSIMLTPGVR